VALAILSPASSFCAEQTVENSIWTGTLAGFREKAGGRDPVPASVAISAVSASLALALLAKVLEITRNRKSFTGDPKKIGELLEAARSESTHLTHLADDDIEAFNQYMDCLRGGQDVHTATRKAIEVPMEAARAAVRGLDLCAEAIGLVQGLTAADLGAAAELLSGAVRAILLSIDFNAGGMPAEPEYSRKIKAERRELEVTARRRADAVAAAVSALSG
jgi:formiminotetrahydrofolate cyclodeaminase